MVVIDVGAGLVAVVAASLAGLARCAASFPFPLQAAPSTSNAMMGKRRRTVTCTVLHPSGTDGGTLTHPLRRFPPMSVVPVVERLDGMDVGQLGEGGVALALLDV